MTKPTNTDYSDPRWYGFNEFAHARMNIIRTRNKGDAYSEQMRQNSFNHNVAELIAMRNTEELFVDGASDQQRDDIIRESLSLAANLSHDDLYESSIVRTKVLAAFKGLVSLQAFVLAFGSPVDDVLALSDDEVAGCYRTAVAAMPRQHSLDVLLRLSSSDVDGELASSMLSGH